MNAIVCYCKPERKSERERNERISSISILLWCWLHFVRNGALMEDKRPVFMTCSPFAPRSPAGRDCHLWAGAQSHISVFITPFFSLSQPHTHKPSHAACSARARHSRYAVDINLHSYAPPTTEINPYHIWITSLSVHSPLKHCTRLDFNTRVYTYNLKRHLWRHSVFSQRMVNILQIIF